MKPIPLLAAAMLALTLAAPAARSAPPPETVFCTRVLRTVDPLTWAAFLEVIDNEVLIPNRTPMMKGQAGMGLNAVNAAWMGETARIGADVLAQGGSYADSNRAVQIWKNCSAGEYMTYFGVLNLDMPSGESSIEEGSKLMRRAHRLVRPAH